MSSRLGNWMIGSGSLVAFLGLILLPASLGQHIDTSLLVLGACGLSVGSIIAASGIYIKSGGRDGCVGPDAKAPGARRVRGGCDICHGDQPLIHCKVHQVHMCVDCMGQHYDPRSCTYAPSARRLPARRQSGLAKAQAAR